MRRQSASDAEYLYASYDPYLCGGDPHCDYNDNWDPQIYLDLGGSGGPGGPRATRRRQTWRRRWYRTCALPRGQPGAYKSTAEVAEVSVPATLQATIAARIDRLDPKAKRTLTAAAVIGTRFGLDLLTVLGVEPVIADLVAAELIDQVRFSRQPEYVFHHPLIRAVAYEAQLKSDRAELHRRLAVAIQACGPASADENAALMAEHLDAAGDLHAAYGWHMRAATPTLMGGSDDEAARIDWCGQERLRAGGSTFRSSAMSYCDIRPSTGPASRTALATKSIGYRRRSR